MSRDEKIMTGRSGRRSGQVMVEYAVVLAVCVGLVAMTAGLLIAFRVDGSRILNLVAFDYP